ncbi:hypothetical protein GTP69_20785 [Duganella sp. CY42W]|uniref:Cytochrome P460 domain-containing protein n=1 Tax=Duganella levis TaxID=2692169 RepID=A0ABW9W528_9BURK|nr:hypothetical protein [Duganella levis]
MKALFIAPAHESPPLDELRVVVGNPVAMAAIEKNQLPFSDGTILVKLAWKHVQSAACWGCCQALVKNHDFVFTRLAP